MKKIFATLIAISFVGTAMAQGLAAVTGFPVPKKSAEPIIGALVTFTSEWDKELKYQRKVDSEGFRVVLPQGGYLLTIEAEGYESYRNEIEVDSPEINLDMIIMLTTEQAAALELKRKQRANRY